MLSLFSTNPPTSIHNYSDIHSATTTYEDGICILQIDRLAEYGEYACTATNVAGQATTTCTVTIDGNIVCIDVYKLNIFFLDSEAQMRSESVQLTSQIEQAPVFTTELHDVVLKEYEQLKLKVNVKSHPEPVVTWMKDGKPVQGEV
jgi:hypothetical protein